MSRRPVRMTRDRDGGREAAAGVMLEKEVWEWSTGVGGEGEVKVCCLPMFP